MREGRFCVQGLGLTGCEPNSELILVSVIRYEFQARMPIGCHRIEYELPYYLNRGIDLSQSNP